MQRNVLSFISISLFTLISILPNPLLAQSFQHELSLDFSKITAGNSAGEKLGNAASYTYYFSAIENSELPLAELEFGNRISSVGLGYSISDTENRQYTAGASTLASGGASTKLGSLFGIYKHAATGWFLGGSFSNGDTDSTNHQDNESYHFNFGKYLTDRTTISFDYGEISADQDSISYTASTILCGWQPNGTFISCGPGSVVNNTVSVDSKVETDAYTIKGRHLQELAGYYFAVDFHYTDSETTTNSMYSQSAPSSVNTYTFSTDSQSYGGEFTAYLGRRFATSLSYSKTEQDQFSVGLNEPKQFGISLDYYFLFGLSASLEYTLIKVDSMGPLITPPIGIAIVPTLNPAVITYEQYRNYSPSTSFQVYQGNGADTSDLEMFNFRLSARF